MAIDEKVENGEDNGAVSESDKAKSEDKYIDPITREYTEEKKNKVGITGFSPLL